MDKCDSFWSEIMGDGCSVRFYSMKTVFLFITEGWGQGKYDV